MTKTQVLVAMDFGGGDLQQLVERMGGSVLSVESVSSPRPTHRIAFATPELRNTHAHGMACAAGFVAHVEFARRMGR